MITRDDFERSPARASLYEAILDLEDDIHEALVEINQQQQDQTRIREEFMQLTKQIGCPEFTRAHNLRHLFITRSQEGDLNPLLVAEIVGQRSIETTRRYTHLGAKSKRETLTRLLEGTQGNSNEATSETTKT